MEILDDTNVVKQRDPFDALGSAGRQYEQLATKLDIVGTVAERQIHNIVITGMGGSTLGAKVLKSWLNLERPVEVVSDYTLPAYVGAETLVIASSYSGNTEETLSAAQEASDKGAIVAITARGGKLIEFAESHVVPYVLLPMPYPEFQPRYGVFYNMSAMLQLLHAYGIVEAAQVEEFASQGEWLQMRTAHWAPSVPADQNDAKQLAWQCAGTSPVVYSSHLFSPVAYKWKISFNENAKNVAWWDELPEFNHNEFIGWSSHPVEKPYRVIDLRSSFDHDRIQKRFELTDRLLSGRRPAAVPIQLQGETLLQQMLWGCIFADFTSIYLALLNQVDPTKVDLVEKLKVEMANE